MTLNFDVPIQIFAAQLSLDLATVVEKISFDLHAKISKRNPVDTGRSRASWQIAEGSPNLSVAPEKPNGEGKFKGASSPPGTPRPQKPDVTITGEQKVYITNNLEYVKYLEDGSSKQAPAGMVAISLREVEAEIEQFIQGMLSKGSRRKS